MRVQFGSEVEKSAAGDIPISVDTCDCDTSVLSISIVKWGIRRERQRAFACAFLAVKVPLINLKARNA